MQVRLQNERKRDRATYAVGRAPGRCAPLVFDQLREFVLARTPTQKSEEVVRERVQRHTIAQKVRRADQDVMIWDAVRGGVQRSWRGRGSGKSGASGVREDEVGQTLVVKCTRPVEVGVDQSFGVR